MYELLAEEAMMTITQEEFVARHRAIAEGVTVTSLRAGITADSVEPFNGQASVPFDLTLETVRLGEYGESNVLPMVYADGKWQVRWSPSVIFKDLEGDNLIRMLPVNPQRGSILDRQGRPLATQAYVLQVGIVPGDIDDEGRLLQILAEFLEMAEDEIKERYVQGQPHWFMPIKELPIERELEARDRLEGLSGVVFRHISVRTYPNGELAAHVVGYVGRITAEDLEAVAVKGYGEQDFLGRSGIEGWGEEVLAGQRGGRLVVVTPQGETVKVITERPAERGADIHLTIDIDIQRKAEEVLGTHVGSVVILDPRDNAILALASYPRFDPNKFIAGFTDLEWHTLVSDARYPLHNRPAASAYPTGSVFKVVTLAAGLEAGGYSPGSSMNAPGVWTIPGGTTTWRDWRPEGHGVIDLRQAITQSANGPFYEIGYNLNGIDETILPTWARYFGLGDATGTVGLSEATGLVPDEEWKERVVGQPWFPGDAVNLSIGQGYFQATPLQIANVYSTLVAGGKVRTPVLVRSITTVDGQIVRAFVAEERQRVPISESTLSAIKDGMSRVTSTSQGTANYAFRGFDLPMAAKTGSAETGVGEPHAWFIGYAPLDLPEVLVTVMLEKGGSAAHAAAPRARQIFDYYYGPPLPMEAPSPPAEEEPAPTDEEGQGQPDTTEQQ